jgi:hypothetical protein
VEVQLHYFLTSALDGSMRPVPYAERHIPTEEATNTPSIGNRMGPRANLNANALAVAYRGGVFKPPTFKRFDKAEPNSYFR